MSKQNRQLINVLIGGLLLFNGIRGLMGIGSNGFIIPDELYVLFGAFLVGYGLWNFFNTHTESENDK
jgi:hypothetical protein